MGRVAQLIGHLPPIPDGQTAPLPPQTATVGLLLVLHAFASGCTALTGVEAISNGVPAFRPPEARNARRTLVAMGLILGSLFIGVSLKDQFEFLMSDWSNKGSFAPGLRDTKDPVIGNNSGSDATFLIPVQGRKRPIELTGLSRFVTCRGAAYCFLPSATALRYISALQPASSVTSV